MKYNLTKKISYSIIILVLLVGLSLTAIFGMNGKAMLAALEGDTHHGGCGQCN